MRNIIKFLLLVAPFLSYGQGGVSNQGGIPQTNGFTVQNKRYLDMRRGIVVSGASQPFNTVQQANDSTPVAFRSIGMEKLVLMSGIPITYQYSGGIADGNLVPKQIDWVSVINKPTFFDGAWTSLTGRPAFALVATSGNYTDLSNKPTFKTINGNVITGTGDITITSGGTQVNADWNATSGAAQILNKPTLFNGAYSSLTGRPTALSAFTNDLAFKTINGVSIFGSGDITVGGSGSSFVVSATGSVLDSGLNTEGKHTLYWVFNGLADHPELIPNVYNAFATHAYVDNAVQNTLTVNGQGYIYKSGNTITAGQIDLGTNVTGQLPNAKLANSKITINGTDVSLGGSITVAGGGGSGTALDTTKTFSLYSVSPGGSTLTPTMTSGTTPAPFSILLLTRGDEWKAWGNSLDQVYGNSTLPNETAIDLGSAQVANKYSYISTGSINDPQKWELLGSNDGTNFTSLDIREKASPNGASGEVQEYTISNTTAYRYYKFYIYYSNNNYMIIGGLQLFNTNDIPIMTREFQSRKGATEIKDTLITKNQRFTDPAFNTGTSQYTGVDGTGHAIPMATPSGSSQVNADWNSTSGVSQVLNKPVLDYGTYTPVLTATSNVTSVTSQPVIYSRSKNVVDIAGIMKLRSTTTGDVSIVDVSLPITSSSTSIAYGTCVYGDGSTSTSGIIQVNTSTHNASLRIVLPVNVTELNVYYTFKYIISN